MKFLIAGLGNPGEEYALSRHNIGFMIADAFADEVKASFVTSRYALHATSKYRGRIIHIIKPVTYMNLSGKAVQYYMQAEGIMPENLLVMIDDIALPFGSIRFRSKGSDGGHNGLTDIIATLQTTNFPRLRFGVGHNFQRGRQADYVLSAFTNDEHQLLPELFKHCTAAIKSFIMVGISTTMNDFNKK